RVYFPTGDRSAYLSDGNVRVMPRLMAAGDIGPIAYAAHAGFMWRAQDDNFGTYARGSEMLFGVSAGLRAAERKLIIGPELYGAPVVRNGDVFAKRQPRFEAILGAHYAVAPDWRIGLGAGPGLTRGFGEPAFRVVASIEFFPHVEEKKAEPPPPPPKK